MYSLGKIVYLILKLLHVGQLRSSNFHEVQISPSTYTFRTNSVLEPSWTATSAYHPATPSLILQEISYMPFFHLVYHSRRASPTAAARAFPPPGEPSRRRGKLYRAMRQRPHRQPLLASVPPPQTPRAPTPSASANLCGSLTPVASAGPCVRQPPRALCRDLREPLRWEPLQHPAPTPPPPHCHVSPAVAVAPCS